MARVKALEGVLGLLGLVMLAWAVVTPAPPTDGGTGVTGATDAGVVVDTDVAALQGLANGAVVPLDLGGAQPVRAQLWPVGAGEPPQYAGVILDHNTPVSLTVHPEGLRGLAVLSDGAYTLEPIGSPGAARTRVVPLPAAA